MAGSSEDEPAYLFTAPQKKIARKMAPSTKKVEGA